VIAMMDWSDGSWGWAGWTMMVLSMFVFWGVVIWAVVALSRGSWRLGSSPPTAQSPLDVLAERFARGEIDEDEYHRRLDVLHGERHAKT
jgi:putative membrane protein